MRLRKEVSKWSFKIFFILTSILLLIYNGFYGLAGYFNEPNFIESNRIYSWLTLCILNPFLLGLVLTTSFRITTLYVNDYHAIPDFKSKLKNKLLSERMVLHTETTEQSHYFPKSIFYRAFNNWFHTEEVKVFWGDEIIISGSMRKLNVVEDAFTWNKDFKSQGKG